MMRLVVLIAANGTGTNLRAIQEGIQEGSIKAELTAIISDADVTKDSLLPLLKTHNPDYICLTGWKQIILDEVIKAFPNKILNLHPGLVPGVVGGEVKNPDDTLALWNKGLLTTKAIENFLKQKATYAGSSIHFLTLEFDFGPVLGRCFEKIEQNDTVDSLYARLKEKENKLYVEVLKKLADHKI